VIDNNKSSQPVNNVNYVVLFFLCSMWPFI